MQNSFRSLLDKPLDKLSESDQSQVMQQASFHLKAQGRLQEAAIATQGQMKLSQKLDNWENVTQCAIELTDMYLHLGKLSQAENNARQAVTSADAIDDKTKQFVSRTRLATTLHRKGNLQTALKHFEDAEKLESKYKWLHSTRGAWYCFLLLDKTAERTIQKTVLKRGKYILELAHQNQWLLAIAIGHLTLGRVLTLLGQFDDAHDELNEAISELENTANRIDYMPEFFLTRADFYRQQRYFEKSKNDLEIANKFIVRYGMWLYKVDATLLRGNLNFDQNQTAQTEYEIAKKLIEKTGYHLRDPELDLLGVRLAFYDKKLDDAQRQLKQARERLEEIGYWGLLPAWERVENEIIKKT